MDTLEVVFNDQLKKNQYSNVNSVKYGLHVASVALRRHANGCRSNSQKLRK